MKWLIPLLALSLVACATKSIDKPVINPTWPDSIKEYKANWEVKVIDGKPFVGMSFEDSQEFRIWLDDVLRYTKEANNMVCFYRAPLKEKRCESERH